MGRERILQVMGVALVGLLAFGLLRGPSIDPQDDTRAVRNRFFIHKSHPAGCYDVVVIGDSRALRGMAPEVIGAALGGRRVFNFAFNAGGLNPEIFAAAEAVLDPGSPQRAIIVAPTALSLIPWKQDNAQYREYLRKPVDEVLLYRHLYPVAAFFRAVPPSAPVRTALGIAPHRLLREDFDLNGWIGTRQHPHDNFRDLTVLSEQLEGNAVDPAVIAVLVDKVKAWTSSGIAVYSCAVPAYEPRVALEDSMLAFDRAGFQARIAAAGASVIDPDGDGWVTYDGSHLDEDSALRYSRQIGSKLAVEVSSLRH